MASTPRSATCSRTRPSSGRTFTTRASRASRARRDGAEPAACLAREEGDPDGRDRSTLARAWPVRVPPGARARRSPTRRSVEGTARRVISRPPRTSRPLGDEEEIVEVIACPLPRGVSSRARRRRTPAEVKAKARDRLVRAGNRARRHSPRAAEARRWFEQALELADDPLARAALHERAGETALAHAGARRRRQGPLPASDGALRRPAASATQPRGRRPAMPRWSWLQEGGVDEASRGWKRPYAALSRGGRGCGSGEACGGARTSALFRRQAGGSGAPRGRLAARRGPPSAGGLLRRRCNSKSLVARGAGTS